MPARQTNEPDVTPLINVNLVILVMALLVASHAALLLPLKLPSAAKTRYIKADSAAVLKVSSDGTYSLDAEGPLTAEQLPEAVAGLEAGQVVMLDLAPGVKFGPLAHAVDCLMSVPKLRVGLGSTGAQRQSAPRATTTTSTEATP